MPSDTTSAAALRPFAEFLSGVDRGRANDEMTAKVAELTEAVSKYGRKGTVTLKIEISPYKGGDGLVEVKATTDMRAPTADHAGVFFFDEQFQLTRDDPSMQPMFGRDELAADRGDRR